MHQLAGHYRSSATEFACVADTRCALCCLQVGLDDVLHCWYRDQQVQQAHNIAASCSAAACRAAARTGIPASARPWVWAAALGLPACPPASTNSCSSHQGDSSTGSTAGGDSSQVALTVAITVKQDAWWHLSNKRNKEKLELLCKAVQQQVSPGALVKPLLLTANRSACVAPVVLISSLSAACAQSSGHA